MSRLTLDDELLNLNAVAFVSDSSQFLGENAGRGSPKTLGQVPQPRRRLRWPEQRRNVPGVHRTNTRITQASLGDSPLQRFPTLRGTIYADHDHANAVRALRHHAR